MDMTSGTPAYNIAQSSYKPMGVYTQFKQWVVSPNTSNNSWKPDEIVKFLLNLDSGVMDPYRSHLQFTIETTKQTLPVGGLQVDSSAHAFISQSVISSYNTQVQRIAQYDTLAAYFVDLGTNQQISEGRDAQGMGATFQPTNLPYNTAMAQMENQFYYTDTNPHTAMSVMIQSGTVLPTNIGAYGGCRYVIPSDPSQASYLSRVNLWDQSVFAAGPNNPFYAVYGDFGATNSQQYNSINTLKHANNVRAQYMMRIKQKSYIQSTSSLCMNTFSIANQQWGPDTMFQVSNKSGFNATSPYQPVFPAVTRITYQANLAAQKVTIQIPNTTGINGFQNAFSSSYAKGCNQCIISPTIPQCQMQNGKILPTKIPVPTKTFRVPLLSNICGALIPPQSFTLIPMKALKNLLVQLTLSKYPVFTTGYCDVHEVDQYGMSFMQPRAFKLTNFNWILHLYTFANQELNMKIQQSLLKQIAITCTGYTLSSQYQIPNGSMVNNIWSIAAQNQSVAEVIIIFLSNDYNRKTYRRKQQRLSNNITSIQYRLNADYYPSQPITGNAGNPQTLDQTGNNWPFYKQLLLSSNFLFNTNFPLPRINPKNFSINSSCYDVDNTNTFYQKDMYQKPQTYKWTNKSINIDTALGMCNWHENRFVGKAVYTFSWEPYGMNNTYLHGIDVSASQNFAVLLNVLPVDAYPRDQTMLIFTKFNQIVVFGANGIKALG